MKTRITELFGIFKISIIFYKLIIWIIYIQNMHIFF